MKYKTPMVALLLLLLGIGVGATSQASAWGYWNGGGGDYWRHGGGYENSYLQNFYPQPSPGAYSNGYSDGIADAVYDHDNNLAYNPVGQCLPCHSQVYWDGFHQGYDTQWSGDLFVVHQSMLLLSYRKKRTIGYFHSQIFSVKFPSVSTSVSNSPTRLLRNASLPVDDVL